MTRYIPEDDTRSLVSHGIAAGCLCGITFAYAVDVAMRLVFQRIDAPFWVVVAVFIVYAALSCICLTHLRWRLSTARPCAIVDLDAMQLEVFFSRREVSPGFAPSPPADGMVPPAGT